MNRRQQNRALDDWNALVKIIHELDPLVGKVLVRGSYDSGHRKGPVAKDDPEKGIPPPYYSDRTGELAVMAEIDDGVRQAIVAMAKHLHLARNLAKWVLNVAPKDATARAELSVPDCLACGRPVFGRVKSGYDQSCYDRWVYLGRPERSRFEHDRKNEVEGVSTTSTTTSSTDRYNEDRDLDPRYAEQDSAADETRSVLDANPDGVDENDLEGFAVVRPSEELEGWVSDEG